MTTTRLHEALTKTAFTLASRAGARLGCMYISAPPAPTPACADVDSAELGDDFLRCAQAAALVGTREQLFVWSRLHLYRFVPHDLMLCWQAPATAHPRVAVFNSVPLPAALEQALLEPHGLFWRQLHEAATGASSLPHMPPSVLRPEQLGAALNPALQALANFPLWLVQGVDAQGGAGTPSVWLAFALRAGCTPAQVTRGLALCLPHLHFALMRVLSALPSGTASYQHMQAAPAHPGVGAVLTERECEVLRSIWRVGSNRAVGELLGISALTVKNHLRNIMRKLGASSRAQAVAEAVARQLIH